MVPAPVQAAAIAALVDDEHVVVQRDLYAHADEVLAPALTALGSASTTVRAGLYLWATRGEPCWDTVADLAARGILVTPGDFYGPAGARACPGGADRHRCARSSGAARRLDDRGRRARSVGAAPIRCDMSKTFGRAPRGTGRRSPLPGQVTRRTSVSEAALTYPGARLPLPEVPATIGESRLQHRPAAVDHRSCHPRPRVRQYRGVQLGDHLHRRGQGDPALSRLSRSSNWLSSPRSSRRPIC